MILARVTGRITSTIHHPTMAGRKLLVLDKLDTDGNPTGGHVIAIDTVGAGAGETVLMLDEGNGARQILGVAGMPVRSVVVGVVDPAVARSVQAVQRRRRGPVGDRAGAGAKRKTPNDP